MIRHSSTALCSVDIGTNFKNDKNHCSCNVSSLSSCPSQLEVVSSGNLVRDQLFSHCSGHMGRGRWREIAGTSVHVAPSQLLFGRLKEAVGVSMCIKRDMWLSTPSPGCGLLGTANFKPAQLEPLSAEEIGHLKLTDKKKKSDDMCKASSNLWS